MQASDIQPRTVPRHLAIIMDGNNRWARREGYPGVAGHRAGAEVVSFDVTATPQRFELPMRDQHGLVTVEIESPSFIPSARAATSRDGRSLGVIVFEVEVNPVGVGERCPSSR